MSYLSKSYCTQQFKWRKVLGSLRYTSQSNYSSSYTYKVNNKHTLHSLPQHNLLEFLLSLYHSIPSHFLMLRLVAQLDQLLIISNNSNWVWNYIVASRMKKTFESQQSIPREHITNNLKWFWYVDTYVVPRHLIQCAMLYEFHLYFHPPKETGFLTWSWGRGQATIVSNHCRLQKNTLFHTIPPTPKRFIYLINIDSSDIMPR